MRRFRVLKDVVIYHPLPLVAEVGAVLRLEKGIIFGVLGSNEIMNESTHPKEFEEHFIEIESLDNMSAEEKREWQLRQAKRELSFAGTRVYEAARGAKPFRMSKLLNVLGKEIGQLSVEVAILLGHSANVEGIEETGYSLPSTKLLAVMQKDGELKKTGDESDE